MNLYTYEKVLAERHQKLQHEMAEIRRARIATPHQANLGQRIVGNVGKSLVSLGTRLERVDPRNELVSRAGRQVPSLSFQYPQTGQK